MTRSLFCGADVNGGVVPNNRQWAALIWLAAIVFLALTREDGRGTVKNLLAAAWHVKIVIPVLLYAAWVAGLIRLAVFVDAWSQSRATDTVFWFATSGLVLFGRFDKVRTQPHFVRRSARATFEWSIAVDFLLGLFIFGLVTELVLLPLLVLLTGVAFVAQRQAATRSTQLLVETVLGLIGLALLGNVVVQLAEGWGSVDVADVVQQLALPVWLTLGVLPFIFLLGLYSSYELAAVQMRLRDKTALRQRIRFRLVLLWCFRARASELGAFRGYWQRRLLDARSFTAGREIVREFQACRRKEELEARRERDDLVRFAGDPGTDSRGKLLDRREFEATIAALQWIATCQMGWHSNDTWGRYRPDLLDFVLEGNSHGLPDPHGVEMRVADAGDRWFAWRRTVTGRVFAIGAAGPPPDQWRFDGDQPPSGYPDEDPVWGVSPWSDAAAPNW